MHGDLESARSEGGRMKYIYKNEGNTQREAFEDAFSTLLVLAFTITLIYLFWSTLR